MYLNPSRDTVFHRQEYSSVFWYMRRVFCSILRREPDVWAIFPQTVARELWCLSFTLSWRVRSIKALAVYLIFSCIWRWYVVFWCDSIPINCLHYCTVFLVRSFSQICGIFRLWHSPTARTHIAAGESDTLFVLKPPKALTEFFFYQRLSRMVETRWQKTDYHCDITSVVFCNKNGSEIKYSCGLK